MAKSRAKFPVVPIAFPPNVPELNQAIIQDCNNCTETFMGLMNKVLQDYNAHQAITDGVSVPFRLCPSLISL